MDRRTRLHRTLNKIEKHLQSLIEGSTIRLFPLSSSNFNLSHQIVAAMENAIQVSDDGSSIAPNLFTINVHPTAASTLLENQTLLDELAEIIFIKGTESGFIFYSPPSIRIKTDPELELHQINIVPEIKPGQPDKTTTVVVEIEDAVENVYPNAFLLIQGDQVYSLTEPVINIGRRVDNHLVINDIRVSRLHAQLRLIDNNYVIFDLDSTSGTFVNGTLIQQHTLENGDVISLAGVQLIIGQDEYSFHDIEMESTESNVGSTRPLLPIEEESEKRK
jgi:pSer/pThr/pTyr-binding forkhead associated (FHA) protein